MKNLPEIRTGSIAPFGFTRNDIATSKAIVNRVHGVFAEVAPQLEPNDSVELKLSGYSSVELRTDECGEPLFFEAIAEKGGKYIFDYDTSGWPSPRFIVSENRLQGTVLLNPRTHTVDRLLD